MSLTLLTISIPRPDQPCAQQVRKALPEPSIPGGTISGRDHCSLQQPKVVLCEIEHFG